MGQSRRPHERVAHDQLSSLLLRQPLESAGDLREGGGVIRTLNTRYRPLAGRALDLAGDWSRDRSTGRSCPFWNTLKAVLFL